MEIKLGKKQLTNIKECALASKQSPENWIINQLNLATQKKVKAEVSYDSKSFQTLLNELFKDVRRINWVMSHLKELKYSGRLTEGSSLHTNLKKLPFEINNFVYIAGDVFQSEIVVVSSRLFDKDVSTNSFFRLLELLNSVDASEIYNSLPQVQTITLENFSLQFENIKLEIKNFKSSDTVKDIVYKIRSKYIVHRDSALEENNLPANQVLFDVVDLVNHHMSNILEVFKPMPLDKKQDLVDYESYIERGGEGPLDKNGFDHQITWYYEITKPLLGIFEEVSKRLNKI